MCAGGLVIHFGRHDPLYVQEFRTLGRPFNRSRGKTTERFVRRQPISLDLANRTDQLVHGTGGLVVGLVSIPGGAGHHPIEADNDVRHGPDLLTGEDRAESQLTPRTRAL